MAHSLSAKKRIRQNEKARLANRSAKREIKTLAKKLAEFVDEKSVDEDKALCPTLISRLDKAAKRHIYHKNTIARQKSQATRLLNSLGK